VREPVVQIDKVTAIELAEIEWQFSRSSGPGGQNVNKTATRVELLFDVDRSPSLDDAQRRHVRTRLCRLIDGAGVLRLVSQASASQWQNREDALRRFAELLAYALRPIRIRTRTRPSRASKQRRREDKSRHSDKKRQRLAPRVSDW
jgi:ribosome-associated protein